MLHPLFRLALDRPDLLADHVGAYSALAVGCAREAIADWRWRALGWAMVAIGLLLALGLGGVALMLHALLAPAATPAVLWLVPALPALLAVGGWGLAHRRGAAHGAEFSQQLEADLALFKEG
jgi:hypothetical protein